MCQSRNLEIYNIQVNQTCNNRHNKEYFAHFFITICKKECILYSGENLDTIKLEHECCMITTKIQLLIS